MTTLKNCLFVFLTLANTTVHADTWFLGEDDCHKLPGKTLEEEFEALLDRWDDQLEVLAPPHASNGVRFFFAVGVDDDGVKHPFYVTESHAACMKGVGRFKGRASIVKGFTPPRKVTSG